MQWKILIEADVPRLNCPDCGVKQIRVAWSEGGSCFTELFEVHVIQVLQAVRGKVQAQWLTALSWDHVSRILERTVECGFARQRLTTLCDVALDEKSFGRGHDYVSVLHDPTECRVIEIVPDRNREATDTLWVGIPAPQRQAIEAVAMDMWEPDMEATRLVAPQALIMHDKFHCAKEWNKAVDLVRRTEHRTLKAQGEEALTKTKYLWLKNPENWTDRQRATFRSVPVDALKVGHAWSVKETFARFWDYRTEGVAKKFFDRWYFWATHSRLPPVIVAAKALKCHLPEFLAYTKHRITHAAAEGMNAKIQLIKANARGYRNFTQYRIAILFHCGKLDLYPVACPS